MILLNSYSGFYSSNFIPEADAGGAFGHACISYNFRLKKEMGHMLRHMRIQHAMIRTMEEMHAPHIRRIQGTLDSRYMLV